VLAALFGSVGRPDSWIPSFRVEPETAWLASTLLLFAVAALNVAIVWAAPQGDMAESAKGWRM
jgi:hypothetical protein